MKMSPVAPPSTFPRTVYPILLILSLCPPNIFWIPLALDRKPLIMLRPSVILPDTSFYPLGNTPAVNLTQCLPPEILDAKVMLAGCGDAKNILFTIYSGTGNRTLDFTCCDIEPIILARNILLYSLIVDGDISNALWDIYYHTSIKPSSLQTLERQAWRLVTYAADATTWEHSPYGLFTSFCNHDTLHRVGKIWSEWSPLSLSPDQQIVREKMFSDALRRAEEHKEEFGGGKQTVNSVRSLAPGASEALELSPSLNKLYHSTGSLDSVSTDCCTIQRFYFMSKRP